MEVGDWKKTKLSLERPYKDDRGERIPVLLDITPDGEQVFESPENPTKLLGENLRRIFIERGVDFFERQDSLPSGVAQPLDAADQQNEDEESALDPAKTVLTPEELFSLRSECIPQLFIALGEMTQARDVLSLLLSSAPPQHVPTALSLSPSALTATVVTKPRPISSVEVFNTQLTIGGKDEALRKAANVFKQAATKLEKSRQSGENYWADALKIRKANWGLVPAHYHWVLQLGKGADKTSKDFFVSFGLEESPVQFRRRAIAHMGTVSLTVADDGKTTRVLLGMPLDLFSTIPPNESLIAAQKEIMDEEVFSRLIVIDVAEGIELQFEMARYPYVLITCSFTDLQRKQMDDDEANLEFSHHNDVLTLTCDLIYPYTSLLFSSSQRILSRVPSRSYASANPAGRSVLLQPIIDLLQYQQFCLKNQDRTEQADFCPSLCWCPLHTSV
ncbi:subunit 17 of mediator complex-domain-containing protein [Pisolithus croceorrhizus]|nr:subunit 17 of mediator complex-domain-containing protein [Pisolithus croceorrhizus]